MDVWLLAAFRSLEHWAEAPGHSRAWTCLDFFLRFCAIFFFIFPEKVSIPLEPRPQRACWPLGRADVEFARGPVRKH